MTAAASAPPLDTDGPIATVLSTHPTETHMTTTTTPTARTKTLIAIVWVTSKSDPDDMSYSFLAYNGGAGDVRVYPRDQYDGRCQSDLPYFDSWAAAEAHMRAAPTGTQCQVTVAALRRVFSLSFAAVD